MKKLILSITGILLLLSLSTYIFIPKIIVVNKSVIIENNLQGLHRSLAESANWLKWWPEPVTENKKILNENVYSVTDHTYSSVLVEIKNENTLVKSSLNLIPLSTDSVKLELSAEIPGSYNPYKRLHAYFYATTLRKDFTKILNAAKDFYKSTEAVYGIDIRRDTVKNSSLVFTTDSSKGYPTSRKIYTMLEDIRKYIKSKNAQITDSPMLNIYTKDSIYYLTRVAIPTDRKLVSSGKIEYRWMLGGGNILSCEIKGSNKKIDSAFAMVEQYVEDYKLIAPAIPFYTLVTNRLNEKDSTRWITKIFYPIMYFK